MSEPNTPAPMGRSPYTRDTPNTLQQLHSDLGYERNRHDYLSQGLEENRQELEHQKASLERNQERMQDLIHAYNLGLLEEERGNAQLEKLEKKGRKLDAQIAIAKQNMAQLDQRIELTVGGPRTKNTEGLTRTTSREPGTAHLAAHIEPRGEREERSPNRQGSSGPVLSMEELNATFQEHASRHNSIEVVGYAGGDEIGEDDNDSEKGQDEEEGEEEDDDDNPAEEEAESESEEENGSDEDDEDAERARMDSHHMDGGSRARTTRPDRVKARTGSKQKTLASSATTRSEEQSIEDGSSESSEESEKEDDEAANSARKSAKAEKKAAKEEAKKESKKTQRKAEQKKAEKRAKRAEKQLRKAAKRARREETAQTEEGAATLLSLAGRDTMSAQPGQSPREDNAGGSKQQRKDSKKAKASSTSKARNESTGGHEDLTIYDVPGSPTPGPSSLRLPQGPRNSQAPRPDFAHGTMGPPPRPNKKRKAQADASVEASKTRRMNDISTPSSHKQREPRSAALKGRERAKAHAAWNGYSSDRQSVALADSEDEMGRFIIQKP